MADASGLFLKAKIGRYKVKFINEKIILCCNCVYFPVIFKSKREKSILKIYYIPF